MIKEHRERRNKNGFSLWFVRIYGRRRRLWLQEYKQKLYAVGCLYHGLERVVDFEEPAKHIALKWGAISN